jgi:lipopolysaccharide cholinephosphotransferase
MWLLSLVFLTVILGLVWRHYPDLEQNYRYKTVRNIDRIRYCLREVLNILNSHHIRYMLAEGTLLGVVRQGDLIEWDSDADLIVFDSNRQRVLDLLRRHLPAEIVVSQGCCASRCVEIKQNNWVDLFFYDTNGTTIFPRFAIYRWSDACLSWLSNYFRLAAFPHADIFPLQKIKWQSTDVWVPNHPHSVLRSQYGPGWNIPQKRANWENVFDSA